MIPRAPRVYTPEELAEWIGQLIRRGDLSPFYNSAAWHRLRDDVLREQHHECQLCRQEGRATQADTVHHVLTVRQRPDLALTRSNLLAVCAECHYRIHHTRSGKWNDERW